VVSAESIAASALLAPDAVEMFSVLIALPLLDVAYVPAVKPELAIVPAPAATVIWLADVKV